MNTVAANVGANVNTVGLTLYERQREVPDDGGFGNGENLNLLLGMLVNPLQHHHYIAAEFIPATKMCVRQLPRTPVQTGLRQTCALCQAPLGNHSNPPPPPPHPHTSHSSSRSA